MPPSRRRSLRWLLGAAVLLALAGWVMLGAEPPPRPPPPAIALPKRMTPSEAERAETRRTWVPSAEPIDAGQAVATPARTAIDPVLALVPEQLERGAVVAEVNAIFNSELGPMLLDCLSAGDDRLLRRMADAGFDPLTHVDRVALFDDTVVMSGRLEALPLPPGAVTVDYGPNAKLIEPPAGRPQRGVMGLWRNQLLLIGKSADETKALIDRLERGEAPRRPAFDDSIAYGEVYGVLKPAVLGELFEGDPALRELLTATARGLTLHADVGHDLGLVGDVEANDPAKADELRRALGAFVSLARLDAQRRGKSREAELLDLAKVRGGDGRGFRIEAGIPHELMKSVLSGCIERGKARAARRAGLDGG
ncbi:MAG: hypothetical protein INH41_02280 [Myxococcaceae bacterium]|jgi:hypothetical protein|nr:hypothetical protein [Myxococcaceae bacterium]MCA3011207.1 hypothetical protein [Myxococcaceae bacterium]